MPEQNAQDGDRLFLATDAFAKWAVQTTARNEAVDWAWFEQLTSEKWSKWVSTARDLSASSACAWTTRPYMHQGWAGSGALRVECRGAEKSVSMPVLTVQQRLVGPLATDDAAVSVVEVGIVAAAEPACEEPSQGASENLPQDQPGRLRMEQALVNPVAGPTQSKGIASWLRGYFNRDNPGRTEERRTRRSE